MSMLHKTPIADMKDIFPKDLNDTRAHARTVDTMCYGFDSTGAGATEQSSQYQSMQL